MPLNTNVAYISALQKVVTKWDQDHACLSSFAAVMPPSSPPHAALHGAAGHAWYPQRCGSLLQAIFAPAEVRTAMRTSSQMKPSAPGSHPFAGLLQAKEECL